MDYIYGAFMNLLKLKNCGCIDFERMDKNIKNIFICVPKMNDITGLEQVNK